METIRDFLTKFKKEEKVTALCGIYSLEWESFYRGSGSLKIENLGNDFLNNSGRGIADFFRVGIAHIFLLKEEYRRSFSMDEKINLHRQLRIEFLEWLIYVKGYTYFSEI